MHTLLDGRLVNVRALRAYFSAAAPDGMVFDLPENDSGSVLAI